MSIDEIRSLSLEYAKGRFARPPRGNKLKSRGKPQTYAEWFARSLEIGDKAGPAPNGVRAVSLNRQTDAYTTNPPGDLPPW